MFILHLALGGCLGLPPVCYGLTADTGGHIAYILEAAGAQSALSSVSRISIVTRLFHDNRLGAEFSLAAQRLDAKTTIDRVATANRAYLEKESLAQDLPAFIEAFCKHVAGMAVRPDVIHAHFADAACAAREARSRFGIPFVYTPHALGIDKLDFHDECESSGVLDTRIAAERDALALANAVIVSTRDEAARQVSRYAVAGIEDRLTCLAPGIPRQAAPTRSSGIATSLGQWLECPEKPVVLAIARPVRKKNLAALMRAYATTPGLQERSNLVILAGQHERGLRSDEEVQVLAELHGLHNSMGLHGKVALPPQHNAADVAMLYRRAAKGGVFVNPALHEPFGLTLIEAAGAGVPVVATRHGGPCDIIALTGHGVLVDPRNEAEIGAACLRVVSDAALHGRLAQAARANADKFSWSRYATESTRIYASICRPTAPSPVMAQAAA